jgi:hypothetical protein
MEDNLELLKVEEADVQSQLLHRYYDLLHLGGSSLPGLCTLDPLLGPPSTLAEFFWRMCLQSHLQTFPPTPQKSNPKFHNPRITLKIPPFSAHRQGEGEVPDYFWGVGILLFL